MARPRKYKSVKEMQAAIEEYFTASEDKGAVLTVCGLTLALGFADRHALLNYEGYGKEFYAAIKRAKLRIENYYEGLLAGRGQAAGPIFWLKNQGWTDKQEFEHTGKDGKPIPISIVDFGKIDDNTK